jgi:hypothetical protein
MIVINGIKWINTCSGFHLEMTLINLLTELNTPFTLFINDGASSDCSSTPPKILCKLDRYQLYRNVIFLGKYQLMLSASSLASYAHSVTKRQQEIEKLDDRWVLAASIAVT